MTSRTANRSLDGQPLIEKERLAQSAEVGKQGLSFFFVVGFPPREKTPRQKEERVLLCRRLSTGYRKFDLSGVRELRGAAPSKAPAFLGANSRYVCLGLVKKQLPDLYATPYTVAGGRYTMRADSCAV